jgi:hypothetical protein
VKDNFNEWATALLKHFFGPHMSGRRTRLTVNQKFLNEEFGFLGGVKGFLSAVNDGPNWCYRGLEKSLHAKAQKAFRDWKILPEDRNSCYPALPDNAPPYIPFLVLLCLAWTDDDDDEHLWFNSYSLGLGIDSPLFIHLP